MKKQKALSPAQKKMLADAESVGFVMAMAGKPTAWILERRGLLKKVRVWTRTRCIGPGYVSETYEYELHITPKGRKMIEVLRGT